MRQFLKFFFHHFYHRFAWTYDFVAALVSVGRWQDWRRAALPHLLGPRLLEIGFGTGHLLAEISKSGLRVAGMDESRQMAAIARANLQKQAADALLTRGKAQQLPFANDSLDCVLSTFPSDYITDPATLAEARRVLRTGGRLVVVPAAWIGGQSLPDLAARWLFRLTGQLPGQAETIEQRLLPVFTRAGFRAEVFKPTLRRSTVLVIVAHKS